MTDRAPAPADVEAIVSAFTEKACKTFIIHRGSVDLEVLNDLEADVRAALLASPALATLIAAAEQRGREDNADHGMCYVTGSRALATLRAHERTNALRDAADEFPGYLRKMWALCREYHPPHWDIAHGNPNRPFGCYPCRMHAARILSSLPDCEGWTCQSCGADNFIPPGFARVIPPGKAEATK